MFMSMKLPECSGAAAWFMHGTSATWSVESGQINGTGGHSPHERAVLGHTTRSLAL